MGQIVAAVATMHAQQLFTWPPTLISAYRLNKLHYDSRHMSVMREQLLKNPESVVAEYGLKPDEAKIVVEVFQLPHNISDQPAKDADPLVAMDAHPIGMRGGA